MELKLEKYEIVDEIGQGGMSVVYRGLDPSLQRTVAIKVMHPYLAKDPDARERFAREARAVARLTHHNIPEIYDFSSDDSEAHYLVTELVEGASLAELLKSHATLPELGALVGLGVAAALQHAHDNDIVHRDVKPENILVGSDGVAKLTDFGIAQFIGLESMTITGTLVGSPAHMSPEQIEGVKDLDARADVWALGTVLYVVATGELPFHAGTPHGVLKRIMDGSFVDPRRLNPHVDSELQRIIRRCLTVERSGRFASMNAVYVELKAWLDERGLEDPEAEIAAWVADPDAYIADLSERLVATLMARAQVDLAAKQRHRALEALNRVLTLAPNNDAAAESLRKLNSGIAWRRGALYSAVGLAVVAVVAVIWFWLAQTPPVIPLPARTAAPPMALTVVAEPPRAERYQGAGATAGKGLASMANLVDERARATAVASEAGRGHGMALGNIADLAALVSARRTVRKVANTVKPPTVASTRRAVLFSATPPAVRATLDGKSVPNRIQLDLTVGSHRYEIAHPGCRLKSGAPCPPTRGSFTVKAGAGVARVAKGFVFPPMTVLVRCKGGTVYRGRQRVGPCGKRHKLPGKPGVLSTFSVRYPSGRMETSGKKSIAPGATVEWTVKD